MKFIVPFMERSTDLNPPNMERDAIHNTFYSSYKATKTKMAVPRRRNSMKENIHPTLLWPSFLFGVARRGMGWEERSAELIFIKAWDTVGNKFWVRSWSCNSVYIRIFRESLLIWLVQGGSNMTGSDLYVNKPHCAAAVRPWESEATTSTLPPFCSG